MKNIYKIVFSAAVLLAGCTKDEPKPENNYSWKTTADLEKYIEETFDLAANTDEYSFMAGFADGQDGSAGFSVIGHEAQTDNFASLAPEHLWASKIGAGQETVPSDPDRDGWKWELLYRCNTFIENYVKADLDPTLKQQYAGEAYFLRAWFYLDKVQKYGDVPYAPEAIKELPPKRDLRKNVMDKVLKDIDLACEYLPTEWRNGAAHRVDKGAALALKSRICLYEGTYRKYHELGDYEKYLTEAVKASEALIALNKYDIYNTGHPESDYAALFTSEDLSSNPEIIFYRKYGADGQMHGISNSIVSSYAGVTKDFVDDFLCLDSDVEARPISLSMDYKEDTYANILEKRDPRLMQIILAPDNADEMLFGQEDYDFPILNGMQGWKTTTGYHLIKYYSKEGAAKGKGNETTDAPLLRYAEVLLNLAEAKTELGTVTQTDLDHTVNLLRARAGMPDLLLNPPMDPKYAGEGITSLLVEIRRERRVELSFEQTRYNDLMRWKQGRRLAQQMNGMRLEEADLQTDHFRDADVQTTTINGKNYINALTGSELINRTFDENKHYLHPLPTSVVSGVSGLNQNPEW